ncbi:MAG: translation initiation factor IF-2, partial [Eubacteriales bacterium]
LMMMGVMASVNQTIDYDTAYLIGDELGVKVSKEVVVTIEEKLFDDEKDPEEDLVERAPVVCVMGHVDHGKTSLLDAIRHTNVISGEAGGITQHIGAYRVNIKNKDITFLDTPGHEAFTAMRLRGAMATDIAIIVVAADDGIMPQTIEAINHAKAAGVDIIVAINKMDKPAANPDAVKQELTKYDLVPEEWGGDVICVPVSAVTGKGIDDLLENILLVAEVKELKANPKRHAKGIVIEAKLDKGRGPVATILVQNGTLHAGDVVIAGTAVGRVRAMTDHNGKALKEAGPSVPVEITGLDGVPSAGDEFNAVEDEKMARELAEQRRSRAKEEEFKSSAKVNLDDLFSQISEGAKEINVIIKADVGGSCEAVKSSLEKLSNDEVKVKVIHTAVGGITESDVMLAAASNAIIVGFNVRPDKNAIDSAARQNVDIRTHRIIYEIIEEMEAAMKGMLAPEYKEVINGHAEVRQTIRVPSVGTIAGSYVRDGKITRASQIRILRDGIVIAEDKISSLRRFKDDVKEVAAGYECGVGLEKFNGIREGDVLEAFVMEEVAR